MDDGSYNGWIKLNKFKKCDVVNPNGHNSFGFSTFLAIIENFLYYSALALGIISIYKIHTKSTVLEDPFEE